MQTSIKIQSQSITSTPLRTLVAGVILSAVPGAASFYLETPDSIEECLTKI